MQTNQKIEISILLFILIEAIFLLLFFKQSILTIILGILLGIILIFLTRKIKKNNLTRFFLAVISIPLGIITFYLIINFIHNNILKNYSLIIIIIPFLIASIYLFSKKYHTFIRTIEISFYLIFLIKITMFVLLIPKLNISNLLVVSKISFNYYFILIGLIILYLYKSIYYLTDYSIKSKEFLPSFTNVFLIKLITISILGSTLSSIYEYPYINALKSIKYFDFIERIDGILSFEYLLSYFFLFTFFLFNIKLLKKPINRFNKS